jgi:hypothetical protein
MEKSEVVRIAERGPRRYVLLESEERSEHFSAPLMFLVEHDPSSTRLDGRYKIVTWDTNAPLARLDRARLSLEAHADHVAEIWSAIKAEREGRGGVVRAEERRCLREAALLLADAVDVYTAAVERERHKTPDELHAEAQQAKGRIFGVFRSACWCYDREQERQIADEYMVTGGMTYEEAEEYVKVRRVETATESVARDGRTYWRVRAMPKAREEGEGNAD